MSSTTDTASPQDSAPTPAANAQPAPPQRRLRRLRIGIRWKLLITFAGAFTIVFAVIAVWIFQYTTTVSRNRLEDELLRSAVGGASTIDAAAFEELNTTVPPVPDPNYDYGLGYPDSPLYELIAGQLYDIRRIVKDAKVYSYFLDPTDKRMYFSASGGYLVPPPAGPVGIQFKVPVDEVVDSLTYDYMQRGLEGTVSQRDAYTDDFGTFISAYTPIVDSAGASVGALGLDYPETYVEDVQDGVRRQLFPVLGIAYIILLILVMVLSTALTRPLRRLTAATRRIAHGEYDIDVRALVPSRFPDEMFTLAESVSEMAAKVEQRERSLTQEVKRLTVEIDHARREEAVKQIVETDFFADLSAKAAEMRRRVRQDPTE